MSPIKKLNHNCNNCYSSSYLNQHYIVILFVFIIFSCLVYLLYVNFYIYSNTTNTTNSMMEHFTEDLTNKNKKLIFQTHMSKEYVNGKPDLKKYQNTWKQFNTSENDYLYSFYDDKACEKFIKNNKNGFSNDTQNAYKKIPNNLAVIRADLFRYCGLYGITDTTYNSECNIYADMDCEVLNNSQTLHDYINDFVSKTDKEIMVVKEPSTFKKNLYCQWFIVAKKKSSVLQSIIDETAKRINEFDFSQFNDKKKTDKWKTDKVYELSGPQLFTDVLNKPENIEKVYEIPDVDDFHMNIVVHHYAGRDIDGWKNLLYV